MISRGGFGQFAQGRLFSTIVIILFAVGITASTLIFSVLNEAVLKPLPVRNPGDLFLMMKVSERQLRPDTSFDYRQFSDLVSKSSLFSASIAAQAWGQSGLIPYGAPESVRLLMTQMVSGNYFRELDVKPLLGRTLTESDAEEQAHPPALLSYQFWHTQFGGSDRVVGQIIQIKRYPFVIVGVLPSDFHGIDIDRSPDIWLSVAAASPLFGHSVLDQGGEQRLKFQILVRLGSRKASPVADAINSPMREEEERLFREWNSRRRARLSGDRLERGLTKATGYHVAIRGVGRGVSQFRDRFSMIIWPLLVGAGILTLTACANIAVLSVTRLQERRRETAVRLALGATRSTVVRHFLKENLILAAIGSFVGAISAYSLTPILIRLLPPIRDFTQYRTPQLLSIHFDWRIGSFIAALATMSSLASGLRPALRASRLDLSTALKDATQRGLTSGIRMTSLSLQIAFCVILVVFAVMTLRTLRKLERLDPGFDRDHVLSIVVDPMDAGYNPRESTTYYKQLIDRVGTMPGVRAAGYADRGVMRGIGLKTTVTIPGKMLADSDGSNTSTMGVSSTYFEAMGVPLIAGRTPKAIEARDVPEPIVINETFANMFFPQDDPIGKFVIFGTDGTKEPSGIVVGVVGSAKYRTMREEFQSTMYLAIDEVQGIDSPLVLYVRTYGNPSTIVGSLRKVLNAVDPRVPVVEISSVEEDIQVSLWQEKLAALLSGVFAGVSLVLAAFGLYGSLTYSIMRRFHEFGIRLALGSGSMALIRTVCGNIAFDLLRGLGVGVVASLILVGLARPLLYGIQASDPIAWLCVAGILALCALSSCCLPLLGILRINLWRTLRQE